MSENCLSADKVKIGAVVLAAGHSRRFEGNKLLLRMEDGRTMLEVVVGHLLRLDTVVAVVVARANLELIDLCQQLQVETIFIESIGETEKRDMSVSARAAANYAIEQRWVGMLLCLADMPFIGSDTYQEMIRQKGLSRASFKGRPGHPVFFPADLLPGFSQLSGDVGAKAILDSNADQLSLIDMDDAGVLFDIDTREQWDVLMKRYVVG
ncbi:molybdenum cofactor cytidylyltransferase [Sinobacterium caligoides]|uniref:Molybdenum cofactor cytidylyltransferase n=1 Tax=Sinobacterium caligoides TaxID=933926 RepID=A0A3N2DJL7_9GAMM|nr:nucleotidyltransferase family protein [Sinobacterium caligoides]ROR99975.1 molybdenum cofactor cytidylyltransferase [Sinobacterium caligoides]